MHEVETISTRVFKHLTVEPLIVWVIEDALFKRESTPMNDDEFDTMLTRCFCKHLKSLSSVSIEEMVWVNEHMDTIVGSMINTRSPMDFQNVDNVWTYISGAIERKRLGYTIINNRTLMQKTGWCHGDILKGNETPEMSKAKNDFMEAAMMRTDRARLIPCLHEWAPIGVKYERGERDEQEERKRLRILRKLTYFITHDHHAINDELLDSLVEHYKWHGSSQYDMICYYREHRYFKDLPTMLYTLYALGIVKEDSSLRMRSDSSPRYLETMKQCVRDSIGYVEDGLPDEFIRENMDICD